MPIIKTRIFDLAKEQGLSDAELARWMGISQSQVCRVEAGNRRIHQDFIVGALRAFPDKTFDDLFYLESETETAEVAG